MIVIDTSQCTYRCVVLPDFTHNVGQVALILSQCTYRCVVLPDTSTVEARVKYWGVSMHLQVRGAP